MKTIIIHLVFVCLLFSCSNLSKEKIVDKSELTGGDYRLFQNTPAWELAKAMEDRNMKKIDKIVSENPELINYQESKTARRIHLHNLLRNEILSIVFYFR